MIVKIAQCPYCGWLIILPTPEKFLEVTKRVNEEIYNGEGNEALEKTNWFASCLECSGLYAIKPDLTITKPTVEELIALKSDVRSWDLIQKDKTAKLP